MNKMKENLDVFQFPFTSIFKITRFSTTYHSVRLKFDHFSNRLVTFGRFKFSNKSILISILLITAISFSKAQTTVLV